MMPIIGATIVPEDRRILPFSPSVYTHIYIYIHIHMCSNEREQGREKGEEEGRKHERKSGFIRGSEEIGNSK